MFKGTYEGDNSEIEFVCFFNLNKEFFREYLANFTEDFHNYWLVRVTTRQMSNLTKKKVFTRADCYLAKIEEPINDLLKETGLYLSEEILKTNNIIYEKIPFSGISIKMASSENFQILKVHF